MLANRAEIPAEPAPPPRGKQRLRTIDSLDGRTIAARRARELANGFATELGGTITASHRLAIERAAALVSLAEDAQARRLAGEPGISLEDVVRVDNAAARAVKALGIKPGPGPKSLEDLASRAAGPVAPPAPAEIESGGLP
jgi:hypothetical protein